jgi:putative ABC transport system permease protein
LLLLLGATSMILLIACGNVALLLLGEVRSRQAEMATRAALGAGRARLLRQLATESALLALVGGLSGIVLAVVAVRAVPALLPLTLPRANEITIDLRILTFALLISSITGLAAGLAPALSAARSVARLAGTRVTGRGTARATGIVMAAQIALSTVLLVSATLFGRSLLRQTAVQPGVDVDRLLAIPILLPTWKHDITTRSVLQQRAHELLGALPGVEAATMTTRMPLSGEGGSWALALPPDTLLSSGSGVAYHEAVMPGFFTVLGIPILEGRDFTIGDGADAERVAIINETMARRYWPGESPLGREFRAPNGGRRRVVGVAGDVRHHGLERPVEATFYEPLAQLGSGATVVLLRTRSQPLALAGAARTIIHQLDPDIPLPEIRTIEGVLSDSMADERFRAALTGSFGWVATLLAAVGLAGVTLRAVAARRRELGVRMALGATPAHAVRLVARGGVSAVAAGLAIGILLSLGVARLLTSQLFGIGAADPVALAAAAAALLMVAALALAVPAAAAARTDPAEVLRVD